MRVDDNRVNCAGPDRARYAVPKEKNAMQTGLKRAVRVALAALAICGLATGGWSADQQRIGYVDLDRISEKATFVRDLMGDLEKALNAKRADLEARQEEYGRLRRELEQRRAVLKESEIEAKLRDSRRLRGEIEQLDYEINSMFRRAEQQQMGPALDTIIETIRQVGSDAGFDLILRGEVVIFGKPALDITDLVADKLNRDYAAGKIKIQSGAVQAPAAGKPAEAAAPARAPAPRGRRPAVSGDAAKQLSPAE